MELIDGCRQGDNYCRRQLYELYSSKMMGICYRYIGDDHTSQDLMHDGFLKIFSAISSFSYKGNGSLRAWMSKVITNTCLEFLRKRQKNRTFCDDMHEYSIMHEEEEQNDLMLIPDDVLAGFIAELPVGYRTVFNLYAFEDVSHKEIAQLLGINESSSRSQLSRAKYILSERIKKYISQNE